MNLEKDFNIEKIDLQPDNEGKNIATFISSTKNTGNRKSVLYIHGFIDYFFHAHLAEAFHENNFNFYAIDLRKYGRSLLPHQTPNYCENIEEYFEEIDISISKIKQQNEELYLLGHSTGGLISSYYMNKGMKKDEISGLILNSPFLDLNETPFVRNFLYAMAKIVVKISPKFKINGMSSVYGYSIHKGYEGEWDFNLKWKPLKGFPVYFKWAIAIVNAQKALHHSDIKVPVLLLLSDKSFKPKRYIEEVKRADVVLDVKDMTRIGPKLGKNVTLIEIKNGIHDLFLAPKSIREEAMGKMFRWLNEIS